MNRTNESARVTLRLRIRAGMAISGPPLGPALGQYGVPIGPFCDSFNEQTQIFRSTVPLMVYLSLGWDGSYDYYIYMPPTTFFFKTMLKIERGTFSPPDVPTCSYFIKYLLLHVPLDKTSYLFAKVSSLCRGFYQEDVGVRRRYLHFFKKKGSFRSITPELLFESLDCYSIRELDINPVISFLELTDYFLANYDLLFLCLNYKEVLYNITGEDDLLQESATEEAEDVSLVEEEELEVEESREHFTASEEEDESDIVPVWYFDILGGDIEMENESVPMFFVCKVSDALLRLKRMELGIVIPASGLSLSCKPSELTFSDFEIANMVKELVYMELDVFAYNIHGFVFNHVLASGLCKYVENTLLPKALATWDIHSIKYISSAVWVEALPDNDANVFSFSMYVCSFFATQPEYFTDYNFRNIYTYYAAYRKLISQLKGQGIFLTRRGVSHSIRYESSLVRGLDMHRRVYRAELFNM